LTAPASEKVKQGARGPKQVKDNPPATPPIRSQPAPAEPPAPVDNQAARNFEEKWNQALVLLKKKKSQIHAVVISAKSRRLENNILTLGFPSEIVKKMMEKNDYLLVFQEILKQVFNEEILIRCIVLTGKQTTPPPGVDSDGMVASALRDLGGEIVDIQ
jgi:hypothetical protein